MNVVKVVEETPSRVAEILEEKSIIEWITLKDIGVDRKYQRFLSPNKVKIIVSNFNSLAAGILIVSTRDDGHMVVLDGQHRLEAMRTLGIERWQCKVAIGLTIAEEADIFIWCNTVTKHPGALDVFKARLVREDPTAIAINECVEKHGLHIQYLGMSNSGKRLPRHIWAVAALERIYQRGKGQLLGDILTLVTRSWPNDDSALEAKVFIGLMHFIAKYRDKYSQEVFIAKMNVTDLKSLFRRSNYHMESGGLHEGQAFAKALQEIYDKGKRHQRLEKTVQ